MPGGADISSLENLGWLSLSHHIERHKLAPLSFQSYNEKTNIVLLNCFKHLVNRKY